MPSLKPPKSSSLETRESNTWRARHVSRVKHSPSREKANDMQIESLRNERSAKAREFSEAQEHISRLMNVMGFTKDRKEDHQPVGRANQKPELGSKQLGGLPSQSYLQSQDDTASFHTEHSIQDSVISTASRNSGHSPKRPGNSRRSRGLSLKSRQNLLEDEQSAIAFHSQHKAGDRQSLRQPLGELDANSPSKSPEPGSKITIYDSDIPLLDKPLLDNSKEKGSLEDIYLDFIDEDIFTSTAARKADL
jgi:hypothetical protein